MMKMGNATSWTNRQAAYGETWYWDNRYAEEEASSGEPFDWYHKYSSLAPLLHLCIPHHHRVLVVGCGNSAFSEDMVNDGYAEGFNIDVSSVAIDECNGSTPVVHN